MKQRLMSILNKFFALKVKLRKARNENAVWIYIPTSQYPIFVSEIDLEETDEYLEQYLRCVLGFQFDHNILLKAGH
jgi:hypothetical protein